jgi:hypothetical protein
VCRIILNYAKFILQLEHTRLPRPEPQPASPACAPPSRSSGGIVRSAIDCGRTFGIRLGLHCAGFDIGPYESPLIPVYTGPEDVTIALWQALRGRHLREHRRSARLPKRPVPAADECFGRAYPAQIDEAVSLFSSVGRRLGFGVVAAS